MMTVENILAILSGLLADLPELGVAQKWYYGESPYGFEIFIKTTNDESVVHLGRVILSAQEIVGFNDASDAKLRDLLRPKIEKILDEAGLPLLK
jgi:hypothetical protein